MSDAADPGSAKTTILVTGDIIVDHHVYIGELKSPMSNNANERATLEHIEFGGAALVERLLRDPKGVEWRVDFGLVKDQSLYPHSFAVWNPFPKTKKTEIWLAREGWYGSPGLNSPSDDEALNKKSKGKAGRGATASAELCCAQKSPRAPDHADLVVIDDGDATFRQEAGCWPTCLTKGESPPSWLVWKMSGGLEGGALWKHVHSNKKVLSRTILIVSASDLQRSVFSVACGLSWEKAALDVLHGLKELKNGPLVECAHLVVSFPDAGALWVDRSNRKETKATLVYDPSGGDGAAISPNRPKAFGYQACLTAGLVWSIALQLEDKDAKVKPPRITEGLRRGLAARRRLYEEGHGLVTSTLPAGFPAEDIRRNALAPNPGPATPFSDCQIPIEADKDWTIVEQGLRAPGAFYDSAYTVATGSLEKLPSVPRLQVGNYWTIERREIEAFRRIRRRVTDYVAHSPQKRPLSIAVFGAPGSGKSFIVEELAKSLFTEDAPFIECNLSQFTDEQDLQGAFHLVRDAVLMGKTPIVFWDEFDSQEYRWLRLLLAPMQDGKFREGQVIHPIGKCIFIFAGGTSSTFEDFGKPKPGTSAAEVERQERVWRMSKGPDFGSRIHAHLNVLGPNQKTCIPPKATSKAASGSWVPQPDPTDACFPIRRALFLRGILRLDKKGREVSESLVRGLLKVRKYTHGSRSLRRVLDGLAQGGFPVDSASLPSAEDLEQDMDAEASAELQRLAHRRDDGPEPKEVLRVKIEKDIDMYAEQINAAYMENPKKVRSSDITLAYDNLSLFNRETNRAAARRIWDVLFAADLQVVNSFAKDGALSKKSALTRLRKRLDAAARKEHEGWCEFHHSRGWIKTKDPKAKKDTASIPPQHPALINWTKLSKENKQKDRDQVFIYLGIVYTLGLAVASTT